jgi:AcrR family transcriptional regulator
MLAAAVDTVREVGYARMTVAQVIARARVSRKTFYDVFADREDCFLAAFSQALDRAREEVSTAYRSEAAWRDSIRAGLARLLSLMEREPGLARVCVVEALGAGERALAARAAVLDELAQVVDRGRGGSRTMREPPALTAEGIVGAVFAVLHARLVEPDGAPLSDLLGPLMSMIVLPYLGARAASREMSRPVPRPTAGDGAPLTAAAGDPLQGLNIRLTYRTMRVLGVIGEHPGASNREIAERAGIVDQGQISKLLGRLAKLELVVNLGEGQERGASNAWHLTARGTQVEQAARPR